MGNSCTTEQRRNTESIVTHYLSCSSAGSTQSQNTSSSEDYFCRFFVADASVISGSNFVGGTRSESESESALSSSAAIEREIPR